MAAFVIFVRTYGIWIFLLCVIGVAVGIKLLIDARRLSRTTLFSLEVERASSQTVRALIIILVSIVVLTVTTFVGMLSAPTPEPPIARVPTATLAPVIFPSATPSSTPTATLFFTPKPSEVTPVPGTPVLAATATRTAPRATAVPLPSATTVYGLPAPAIIGPVPNGGTWYGEGQANAAMTFRWNCDQCTLGPNDWYEVAISFIDRNGVPRTVAGRTQDKFLALRRIYEGGGFEIYQKAKEDAFQWHVQVKREPGNQPLSPPSATWKFVWK